MLLRVALVKTEVSEDLSASIIRMTRIDELGRPEDAILHSQRHETLKSYMK
jgi:hypothetical protein